MGGCTSPWELAHLSSTPNILGERLYWHWDFKRVLSEGYVNIIQHDPSHAGGITETRKIASMAEAYVRERAAEGHRWRNPVWRHADGSFAEG